MDHTDSPVKDDPLREDIRLLGRMLGDTLREQEGEPTFDLVENIRQTAISFRREQDPKARHELDMILNQLSNKATVAVVRAFSHFLNFPTLLRTCITIGAAVAIFEPVASSGRQRRAGAGPGFFKRS